MRADIEALRSRINRLKSIVAECGIPRDAPEQFKHILRTAPKMFKDFEKALRTHDLTVTRQIHEAVGQVESHIDMVVGAVKGKAIADNVRSGKGVDAAQPANSRLNNRLTRFMMPKMNAPLYSALVREFAGEDAIQGNAVRMDPWEVEAFSQWLTSDIILPGESKRLIESFATAEMDNMPSDERALLKSRLEDRPSIYKVESGGEINAGIESGAYMARDLLAPNEVIQIRDRATSKTLPKEAVFIARPVPVDGSATIYSLFGTIKELPPRLWSLLSPSLDKWREEFLNDNPNATPREFFRSHHARLRREMLAIVSKC
jgi:hypothetical protein